MSKNSLSSIALVIAISLGIASGIFFFFPVQPSVYAATSEDCTAISGFTGNDEAPTDVTETNVVAETGDVPEYCHVIGKIDSTIGFRVRLPLANWNGKFVFGGCGGACGSIEGGDAGVDMLRRGYVTATTDMGHHRQFGPGFAFAYNSRQREIDFGYRSTHVSAVMAKLMIRFFYGSGPEYSYHYGGSTGGRQGLVEAQRYPADFDGIVVAYPVTNQTGIGSLHLLWSALSNMDENGNQILTPDDARILHAAAVAKCDGYDWLADGLIDDPGNCDFDPSEVECDGDSVGCLTRKKVEAARKIYDGPRNSAGERLTPGGAEPGSEINWIGNYISEDENLSAYYIFGGSFTQSAAFEVDPPKSWLPKDFDWEADPARLAYMEQFYTATNTDLTTFRDLDGKIIMIQGWADQAVLPMFSVDYYKKVMSMMGGEEATQEFFRFFTVPGFGHNVGPGSTTVVLDTMTLLEEWVENGKAPEHLVASYVSDAVLLENTSAPVVEIEGGTVVFERPLFPYPTLSMYNGGDPTKLSSFDPVRRWGKNNGPESGQKHTIEACDLCIEVTRE